MCGTWCGEESQHQPSCLSGLYIFITDYCTGGKSAYHEEVPGVHVRGKKKEKKKKPIVLEMGRDAHVNIQIESIRTGH